MIKKFIYFEIIKNLIILVILVELAVHVILFILFYSFIVIELSINVFKLESFPYFVSLFIIRIIELFLTIVIPNYSVASEYLDYLNY